MDDFKMGQTHHVGQSGDSGIEQIWLWHRRFEQNGVVECKNRHILETTRVFLLGAHVPSSYWPDVVITVVHLINQMPSWIMGFKTPLQALAASYATNQKGHRCYDPTNKWLYVTMDVTFLESEMFYHPSNSFLKGKTHDEELNWFKDIPDIPLTTEPPMSMGMEQTIELPMPTTETPTSIAKTLPHSTVLHDPTFENIPKEIPEVSSHLVTKHLTDDGYQLPLRHNCGKPPERYSLDIETHKSKYPIANYISTEKLSEPLKSFSNALLTHHISTSVDEALQDLKWVQAMKEEMKALLKNKTWILVSLPEGHKIVGCKWVFSIKYKADGSIERYKARLVVK
ncbi:Retrovirus-related Pol polyprotein from transposon TNT 1-94 [Vitis vinifera]|uniref:Retrovirus-related Pol polyprotein from transposon TNT 1-94 n=1 Tax=Vitis vinifera TaxID=29760 RepID=A0A438GDC3_VITVI|nr:Retrovirus-related Pol polyprotein from transposon TNT 1-94 [Vitis vinifera]